MATVLTGLNLLCPMTPMILLIVLCSQPKCFVKNGRKTGQRGSDRGGGTVLKALKNLFLANNRHRSFLLSPLVDGNIWQTFLFKSGGVSGNEILFWQIIPILFCDWRLGIGFHWKVQENREGCMTGGT